VNAFRGGEGKRKTADVGGNWGLWEKKEKRPSMDEWAGVTKMDPGAQRPTGRVGPFAS